MKEWYCIDVVQMAKELSDVDDRVKSPAGKYAYYAESYHDALDQFHSKIPVGCLEDFGIICEKFSQ